MLKTTLMLYDELREYINPTAKIRRMVAAGELIPVVRGLYETVRETPGYCLAGAVYGPSYLSFEFALAWHGLIPEAVYQFTSATFRKNRRKEYETPFGRFSYRDVPDAAYPYGVELYEENGYDFQIATAEKALCDQLHKLSPCRNQKDLRTLLFENLRIEREAFEKLDREELMRLAALYHTKNHKLLIAVVRKEEAYGSDH